MRTYWRPIPQTDPARPPDALSLAGGWCWFDRVERLARDAPPAILPATDAPPDILHRLTAPRAPIAGLSWDRPRVMGVLNLTPDSFSDGGLYQSPDNALAQARAMAPHADLLDLGAESTRPGAQEVPAAQEAQRLLPVLSALAREPAPLSVDTRKAAVAQSALAAGARLLNDVSALRFDPAMVAVARDAEGLCLMHAQGSPETMQDAPSYDDVLLDVFDHLEERAAFAEAQGVAREGIILDPGLGFGKTLAHNVALVRRVSLFHALGCVLLLGASRKGFVGKLSGEAEARSRAPASLAVTLEAARQGVQIHRVHDAAGTAQALRLFTSMLGTT